MDLDIFPENLIIIGGRYIGLEFASMYSRFGSKVTVIQDGEIFLPKEDDDISKEIKTIPEETSIKFYLGTKIKEIKSGSSVTFNYKENEYKIKCNFSSY